SEECTQGVRKLRHAAPENTRRFEHAVPVEPCFVELGQEMGGVFVLLCVYGLVRVVVGQTLGPSDRKEEIERHPASFAELACTETGITAEGMFRREDHEPVVSNRVSQIFETDALGVQPIQQPKTSGSGVSLDPF
ncbi:MAG: hypothetical protein M3138_06455, partial [Actinomycetota bacterium]|nr:hypothetical protein [Actinomycetota bacterium]